MTDATTDNTAGAGASRRVVARVLDAERSDVGGAVHVVLSGDLPISEIAEQVANGGGRASVEGGRLDALALLDRLTDAAGRVGGSTLADAVGTALRQAVRAWRAGPEDLVTRAGTLPLAARPVVMGIVNVTPDSFSDGGLHLSVEAAVAHGERLLAEGADILDIGGESTRPGAVAVTAAEEKSRVLPVIEALAGRGAIVSVDTSKASVARAAVEAGAAIVNDVSAGSADRAMLASIADLEVPYVVMHARGTPRDMQDDPQYDDVVAEVFEHLADAVHRCVEAGVSSQQLLVDPGIGFGKTTEHNLALLGALGQFRSLGAPVLVGASRKSFLGAVTGVTEPGARLAGSVAAAVLASREGAAIVRVHDVRQTVEALRVASAVRVGEPVAWEPARPAHGPGEPQ